MIVDECSVVLEEPHLRWLELEVLLSALLLELLGRSCDAASDNAEVAPVGKVFAIDRKVINLAGVSLHSGDQRFTLTIADARRDEFDGEVRGVFLLELAQSN